MNHYNDYSVRDERIPLNSLQALGVMITSYDAKAVGNSLTNGAHLQFQFPMHWAGHRSVNQSHVSPDLC